MKQKQQPSDYHAKNFAILKQMWTKNINLISININIWLVVYKTI